MNNKSVYLIIVTILVTAVFPGCRKGKDDPLISLRTRKARLTGNWTLKSGMAYTEKGTDNSYSAITMQYRETSCEKTTDLIIGTSIGKSQITQSYEYKIKFKTDGTFESRETTDGYFTALYGKWSFASGVGKAKNKEVVVIIPDSLQNGNPSVTSTTTIYNGNTAYERYNIRELRNKKLVLVSEGSVNNSMGLRDVVKKEYVFEQ